MSQQFNLSASLTQNWDKNGNIYYTDENGEVVAPHKLPYMERLGRKVKAFGTNLGSWLNNTGNEAIQREKLGLITGLLTLPFGGEGFAASRIGTGLLGKLTPFMGKKIAQNFVQGMGAGGASGLVEGSIRGIAEGENPVKTALTDGAIGLLCGGAGGYAVGKFGQGLARRGLQDAANREQYFNDYISGLKGDPALRNDVMDFTVRQKTPFNKATADFKMIINGGEARSIGDSDNPLHLKQLQIIENTNPAPDTYHTWIRNAEDIHNFEDTLKPPLFDADFVGNDFDPSYTWDMAQDAIKNGKITVHSSYPIETGTFVTPSEMEALSYSGNGKIYSREVPLSDVAWIDERQGQYAPPDLASLYDNIIGEPLKYTGEYVINNGIKYPEVSFPINEYARNMSDLETYIGQNKLQHYKDIIKRYYPEYNIDVVLDKTGKPRIINKGN